MASHSTALALALSLAWGLGAISGCSTTRARPVPVAPEKTSVWRGDGTAASWDEMMADLASADAVFLGEEHDDGAGHALQREIVEELFTRWGGGVLSLEMLERDEQESVDLWLVGDISEEEMIKRTGSASWSGEGSWDAWYQPLLDEAREHGGSVTAANAPREHVRTALRDGFDGLPGWSDPERANFDIPGWEHPEYWEALRQLMLDARRSYAEEGAVVILDHEDIDRAMRSQLIWDATMSRSASAARARGKVIHVAGHFHIDGPGATVGEYRRLRPDDTIRRVTVRQSEGFTPGDDEIGQAEWIVGSASAVAPR